MVTGIVEQKLAFMCIRLNLLCVVIFNANNLLKRFYKLEGFCWLYLFLYNALRTNV